MAVEIERKFLVEGEAWRAEVAEVHQLHDGLIAHIGDGKVRVRKANGRAWLTLKGPREGLVRAEFEYEIPTADADEILATFCGEATLTKVRHRVPHGAHVWSVDVHDGALEGVVLAEIELASPEETFALPAWAGREVTHDPAYRKRNLLARAMAASDA